MTTTSRTPLQGAGDELHGLELTPNAEYIPLLVPLSPNQVLKKRNAIFCHQSQKDGVMFQGDDNREFWLRAEHETYELDVTW